jgi:hypothetical protein
MHVKLRMHTRTFCLGTSETVLSPSPESFRLPPDFRLLNILRMFHSPHAEVTATSNLKIAVDKAMAQTIRNKRCKFGQQPSLSSQASLNCIAKA